MTKAERALWRRIQRRVALRTPDMNKAILEAFRKMADQMTDAEIRAALAAPDFFAEAVLDTARLDRAMLGVRREIQKQVGDAVQWWVPELPDGGRIQGVVAVGFDVLDPRVIEAIGVLQSRVMQTLGEGIREGLRVLVREGLEQGVGSEVIARRARELVGLAPNQMEAVENFRRALIEGDFRKALGYRLRDRRFDRTLERLASRDGSLSAAQVERMTGRYAERFLAWNARVNAGTAVRDAQRLGKHLATRQAIEAGLLDADRMFSRWVNSGDGRVRPLHVQAGGEVTRFGEPFPTTGEVIPGESTFNCRCIKFDWQATPEEIAAMASVPSFDPQPLRDEERSIAGKKVEFAAWFDSSGNLVARKTSGAESFVLLSQDDIDSMKDGTFTHNHPAGYSFSVDDANVAHGADLAEIRAVGSVYTYRLLRPAAGWGNVTKLLDDFRAIEREVKREFLRRIETGTMTLDEASMAHAHEIWTRIFSDESRGTYIREMTP